MSKRTIIFRADGGPTIGMGHFIRSLALAEMLNEDFNCVFATRQPTLYQKSEISKVCVRRIDLPEDNTHFEVFLSHLNGDEIVVLDNYYFTTEYQKAIKDKGCKLVCIDDMHDKHYVADIVINHSPGLNIRDFSVEKDSKLLLGPKYSLLRNEFFNSIEEVRENRISKVLIVFGGVDLYNLTLKYLIAFYKSKLFSQISIITGDAYQHTEVLNNFMEKNNKVEIRHHHNIVAKELLSVAKQSDIAIAPASTVLYELLALKIPVVSGYYVDNQINIYKGFAELGAVFKGENLKRTDHVMKILKDININDVKSVLQNQKSLVDSETPQRFKIEFGNL